MDPESSASYAHGAESWRPIPGYEGRYDVSDQGRVRSLRFRTDDRVGVVVRRTPRVLRPRRTRTGYLDLTFMDGRRPVNLLVHRLVLMAFVGPCPPGHEGAHLNGDRADNRLDNLRWVTSSENERHKVLHGTVSQGEASGQSKLTAADVVEMRAAAARGETFTSLGARYGVSGRAASMAVHGTTWRGVP